ncbi:MAG: hypothetical protein ACK5LP_00385 [Campylobacteraceae bacterium]
MKLFLKALLLFVCVVINLPAQTKSIFLNFGDLPTRVYKHEIVPITINGVITRSDYDSILTTLTDTKNYKLLNADNPWIKDEKGQFSNTFYVKVLNNTKSLAGFTVELQRDNAVVEKTVLQPQSIESIKLNVDDKFSGVLAKTLHVKSYSTSRYDDALILLTVEIETTLGNLEDFRLKKLSNSTVNMLSNTASSQKIQFNTFVPNFERALEFTYFNTQKNSFEQVRVPIELKIEEMSTHVEINPKKSKMNLYKSIALGVVALILIVVFYFKRFKILIAAAIALVIYIAYINNPFNDIIILKDTSVYLLPMQGSTIFYVTENAIEAERLLSKNGYMKVLLPNGRIGWIKEENAIKN